jgi:hypothetical protein
LAGVDHLQVVAEEVGVVGKVAPVGAGEELAEVELGLLGLSGEQGDGVAADLGQSRLFGQGLALRLGGYCRIAFDPLSSRISL